MLKKLMNLPLVLLMLNAQAMDKFAPKIEVIVGQTTYQYQNGDLHALYPTIEYCVRPDTTVVSLKTFLVLKDYLENIETPLYADLNFDAGKPCNIRKLQDDEHLDSVAKEVARVSLYPTIFQIKQ